MAEVDTRIDTVLAGNPNDVSQLLQFTKLACTHADGLGGPPKCAEGETEGALVDVFPVLGPEGHPMHYSNLDPWTGIPATGVYAVYGVSSNAYSDELYPAGEYAIVFLSEQKELLVSAQVANGNIVRIDNNLGNPPEINLDREASEIILGPQKIDRKITNHEEASSCPTIDRLEQQFIRLQKFGPFRKRVQGKFQHRYDRSGE